MIETQQRSNFVTVLAWIFIGLSGFSTLIAVLQNVMIQTLFRSSGMEKALQSPPPDMPAAAAFMFSHFQLFFLVMLLLCVFTLISAIGLLKRRNWARLCFVGIMLLGIVWQFVGLGINFSMFSSVQEQFAAAGTPGAPDMRPFFIAITVVSVLVAIGFSALFAWIAKRLLSAPIAAEFRR